MKLFDVYPLINIEPTTGKACQVFDESGKSYLDLYGGHAVISIGHSHPHYIDLITKQLNKLGFYSNSVIISQQTELAEKLGELSGYPDYELFLSNSGAEANENALKLASFYTGRSKVLAFKGSFHGRTSGAVAITDNPSIVAPINPTEHVTFVEMEDTLTLELMLSSNEYAAVIIEGIQGVNGIDTPSPAFLQSIQTACAATNTVFILDEVQSGYGRSGKFFAHQHAGVKPDLITTAKGMGNGFPVAGLLINPKFKAKYGMLGTTFGGNHLACAAAIAVLDVIKDENLVDNAAEVGAYLISKLKEIPQVQKVKGVGLIIGIDMGYPINDLRTKLIKEQSVFTGSSNNKNVLRLLPPLCLSKQEADQFIESFKKVLEA